jgi:CRP-like cAMP-binding protein
MGYLKTPAGTEIFRQGEVGTNFYVILQGSVNVLIKDTAGGEGCNVVATLYGGDSFGEPSTLNPLPYTPYI